MLPLAGAPRLTMLGREVRLGTGAANLLAVESSGRLVIIEVGVAN
jgi:RecB family endonuclease NucS